MSNTIQPSKRKKKKKTGQDVWPDVYPPLAKGLPKNIAIQKATIEAKLKAKLKKIQQEATLKPNTDPNEPIFMEVDSKSTTPNSSTSSLLTPLANPNNSGQQKPVQENQPNSQNKTILSKGTLPTNLGQIYKINDNPLGPKFIPIEETEPKAPLSTKKTINTLVGNRTAGSLAQKKILKFHMQMQAKQQEKQKENKIAVETIPKPNPVEVTDTPDKSGTPAPVPATEIVETVFAMDNYTDFFTEPEKIPQQPLKNPHPQQPKTPLLPTPTYMPERYGVKYPAGIPKSFLKQQPQHTMMQMNSPAQPDFPMTLNHQPSEQNLTNPLTVQTEVQDESAQPYSPSELYNDIDTSQSQNSEETEASESNQGNQKRLSAFRRLGPQTQPKKPKLTISVTVNEDQEVREVVDETEESEEITPVHLRENIMLSTDETVMKYLRAWPWKRNVVVRKSVTARRSKTVMILEREQMEEIYDKETLFVQVSIVGYPPSWTKEQILDLLLDNMRGYSFIPCFIEFNREACKFLTLRCRSALLCLHKCGFIIRKDDVELIITLGQTDLTLSHLDFVPRLILRKRLLMCAHEENKLDLSAFTLKEDISHFIYFPLNRLYNQTELIQLKTEVNWALITELDLSHNRIYYLDGFELQQTTPKLKHLNLSHNCISRITALLVCRNLPLQSIHLEGNPLCTDYIDPNEYVKVIRMIFPRVKFIDDIPVQLKGEMPKYIRNYCPDDAKELVEKFLQMYFPLLDDDIEHRAMLKDMYEVNASMTITHISKFSFGPIFRMFMSLFQNSRQLEEDNMAMIKGSAAIIKNIASWPRTEHDPFTFTVDVLYHNDSTTILRIDGILKLTRETLAEDEYLLAFSRTLVLHTRDYVEYKIQNEMLHWSVPTDDYARSAFAVSMQLKAKPVTPKIDTTTDAKLQEELLNIFMKLTSVDKKISERCLEFKKWNLKEALEHFTKLLKLNSIEALLKDF